MTKAAFAIIAGGRHDLPDLQPHRAHFLKKEKKKESFCPLQ